MIALNYIEKLPICFSEKNAILRILSGKGTNAKKNTNMCYAEYVRTGKKTILSDDFNISEDCFGLMSVVNRMIKDEKCPNNLKNRFYTYKGRIIKEAIKQSRVSDVYDEGSCVSLIVDNKYKFHQLKDSYAGKNLIPIGTRNYGNEGAGIAFDFEVYKQFQLSAILFLGKLNYTRLKNKNNPKCCYSQK